MSRAFKAVCDATTKTAMAHHASSHRIAAAFIDRYGITYNDADVDWLIDQFDYGGGSLIAVSKIDKLMTDAGHPPLRKGTPHDR